MLYRGIRESRRRAKGSGPPPFVAAEHLVGIQPLEGPAVSIPDDLPRDDGDTPPPASATGISALGRGLARGPEYGSRW